MSLTKYISEKQKDKEHLPCLAFYYKLKNKKTEKNRCWRIRIYVRKNHAENKNQMRWGVEVIGLLNLCFFFCLQRARKNLYTFFVFCFLFFFFFFVYSVHINHFFLPYDKNLCTFFTFFGLPCAHQSFFSFLL